MKNIIIRLTLTSSLILLAACGGGGGGSSSSVGAALTIVDADGTDIAVNNTALNAGVTTACFTYPGEEVSGPGRIQTLKIVDSTYTWTLKLHDGNYDCSLSPTSTVTVKGTYTVKSTANIVGWDGTVPTKQDGSASLPTTASYTLLNTTVTSSSDNAYAIPGTQYDSGYIIDNSKAGSLAVYNLYGDIAQVDAFYIE